METSRIAETLGILKSEDALAVSEASFKESSLELAGSTIQMRTAGEGKPLLVLHGELGFPGWMNYHETLAVDRKLYAPSHPGYDQSDGIDWMMQVRDLAGWYLEALDDMDLEEIDVIGFSFGGWLAAEMAVMDPTKFRKLVLVAPMGVKPEEGEIYDIFLNLAPDYLKEAIHDSNSCDEFDLICPDEPSPEMLELWEVAREQSCKLGWKPYMYSLSLKHLLHRLKNLETLIVWGKEDKIVPIDAGRIYHESIPGSSIEVMENIGHRPEIEKPNEFTKLITKFLGSK